MHQDWKEFGDRLRRTAIRTLDVIKILLFDAVVLAVGYVVTRVAAGLSGSGSRLFEFAREVSGGVFLLLYLAWVIHDMIEFFRRK